MTVSVTRRLRFPEDRTAFIYQQPGQPILTPFRTGLQVFADQAGTQMADIVTEQGGVIPFSTIYTGEDSLLPLFFGPEVFVNRLWAKVIGGSNETYPLFAQYDQQLAIIPTLMHGHGAPPDNIGVPGSTYIDIDAFYLYGPKTTTWPPGVPLQGPQGVSGNTFEYAQIAPSSIWIITHPLNFRPNVTVIDSAGFQVFGDVSYPLANQVVVQFTTQLGGTALLS